MRGALVAPRVAPKIAQPAPQQQHEGPRAPRGASLEWRPSGLLWIVAGLMLTDLWRLHDFFPVIRALRPSIALTALGLLVLVVRGGAKGAAERLRSPVSLLFIALAALALAGLPFSIDPADATRYFTSRFLTHALVGLLVAASVRCIRDAEFLVVTALVGAVVYNVFMHVTVPVGPEGRWELLAYREVLRYYDVNDLALMLVVMIPLTLYYMRAGVSTPRRVLAAGCFVLFAFSLIRTGSRGGFLGFAVVFVYLLVTYRAVSPRMRFLGALVTVAAIAVGGQVYLSRIETIVAPSRDYNVTAETGRLATWRRGVGYMADRPVVGLGIGQFRTAERQIWSLARQQRRTGGRPLPARGAHNMLFQIGAELGAPALCLFIALLAVTWRTLTRLGDSSATGPHSGPALAGAFAASFIGFVVCGMFLHAASFPIFPTLLGFAVALAAIRGSGPYLPLPGRGGLSWYAKAPRRPAAGSVATT
jgi:O-antigen ligase